jgi:L-ascorbate metabolism protein UlaG (beta-lactamase superfamily)
VKVQFIGHASILIESKGIRILSDPWWRGPCFGAQWWAYPPPAAHLLRATPVAYVYISHGHHDHLHLSTLGTLASGFKCLVSSEAGIAATLREHGYPVIEVRPEQPMDLGQGVQVRIWPTDGDDTLMVVSDGTEVLVNANDALHAAASGVQTRTLARLTQLFPKIDYLFCGYGTASHFPNCYNIPGKNRDATARQRQLHFNEQWGSIAAALKPRYAFPFAADVALLEKDLFWVNEAIHNGERPTETLLRMFPGTQIKAIDVAPGFLIEDGRVVNDKRRAPLSADSLAHELSTDMTRANTYGAVPDRLIDELLQLLRNNLEYTRDYMASYPRDYRFLVRFHSLRRGIAIVKTGSSIDIDSVSPDNAARLHDYDLRFLTRAHYLRSSLRTKFGHEILFVGSGGVFDYERRKDAERNLHRELMVLLTRHDKRLSSRQGVGFYGRIKRRLKSLLRKPEADLYDLKAWTVFYP